MELMNAVEWGHWGLTFYVAEAKQSHHYPNLKVTGDAVHFVAELPFAVGSQGPIDGYIGSDLRRYYGAVCLAWRNRGELPEGAQCAISKKWMYQN
jgi:hypothetical protein